tara:strand:+ start:63 stop:338 length:276 start_codon:yes stop_codon:yes gene_type:complete
MKNKIELLDINITLALFKCFTEHLHSLKGTNSMYVKQKFNKLIKIARQYEKEIDKSMKATGDETPEFIYDSIMEYVLEGRESVVKNIKENQ